MTKIERLADKATDEKITDKIMLLTLVRRLCDISEKTFIAQSDKDANKSI